jgi:hypothetical protein
LHPALGPAEWRVVCHLNDEATSFPWSYLPVIVIVLGVAVACCLRKLRCATPACLDDPKNPRWMPSVSGSVSGTYSVVEPDAQAIADLLLAHLEENNERKNERVAQARRLQKHFGFQKHNVDNQLEHIESLLISELSVEKGDYTKAVVRMHEALIAPLQRWRSLTSMAGGLDDNDDGFSMTFTPATAATLPAWDKPNEKKLVNEVLLYLLIWGEAANLRFMPEMLAFIFELARAAADTIPQDAPQFSWDDEDSNPPPAGSPQQPRRCFLEDIVKPLYYIVFFEKHTGVGSNGRAVEKKVTGDDKMPDYPMNYDDFNECFWTGRSLRRLVTTGGEQVMKRTIAKRYDLLKHANWKTFFAGGKSFRELRWWYCLLASTRRVRAHQLKPRTLSAPLALLPAHTARRRSHHCARRQIFLCHAVCFCVIFAICIGRGDDDAALAEVHAYGHWPALTNVLSFALLLAPLSHTLGLAFEVWAIRNPATKTALRNAIFCFIFMLITSGFAFYIRQTTPLTELFENTPGVEHKAWQSVSFVVAQGISILVGLVWLTLELNPRSVSSAFDSHLFFERRTSALFMQSLFKRGSCCTLRPELKSYLGLTFFWSCVWGAKILVGSLFLMPTLFTAHAALVETLPPVAAQSLPEGLSTSVEMDILWWDPATVLTVCLIMGLWFVGALIFVTETAMWYNVFLALIGGTWRILKRMSNSCSAFCHGGGGKLSDKGTRDSAAKLAGFKTDIDDDQTLDKAWFEMRKNIANEMYKGDLISADEERSLRQNYVTPKGAEARRRLQFFLHSLTDPELEASKNGPIAAPTLTTLIPHYGEVILQPAKGLQDAKGEVGFLKNYFEADWNHFKKRTEQESERELKERKWASERMQTLYRTVKGMFAKRRAYELLLELQLPGESEDRRKQLVDSKFTCLVAMQRYGVFRDDEIVDSEAMFDEFPEMKIAFLVEEKQPEDPRYPGGWRYFSCYVDKFCDKVESPDPGCSEVRRKPKYRIELPGWAVFNGKADNQNCAIVYSRGSIIQAIDANQEGYLEEGLKLPCALSEFEKPVGGATRGPAIVGFREHIFSGLGSLGDFGAGSEMVFGTLVQRTMASVIWSRLHYGHPDMMHKCSMIGQGGISKGTKTLNLSEDIFAGKDATLRGHTIVHREYYQEGKGRDMGFLSILGACHRRSNADSTPFSSGPACCVQHAPPTAVRIANSRCQDSSPNSQAARRRCPRRARPTVSTRARRPRG